LKPTSEEQDDTTKERRQFLILFVAGATATIVTLGNFFKYLWYVPPSSAKKTGLSWPKIRVVNIRALGLLKPITFNYPLVNTPNLIVRLGTKAENGVGPDDDVVSFSLICQHMGCYYSFVPRSSSSKCNPHFKAPVEEGYCCCHGSAYDFTRNARVISGPAPRPVPRVILDYDEPTGDIYAVAMGTPTIFGHGPPGVTDPQLVLKYDLEGGEEVTQSTLVSG
jgi:arsenite oxidase small subunit